MNRIILACALAAAGCDATTPHTEEALSSPTLVPVAFGTNFIYTDDLDGDGNLDLYVSSVSLPTNVVSVLYGDGHGHFSAPLQFNTFAPNEMVSADFTGDGLKDIAGVNYDGHGGLGVFKLIGDGLGGYAFTSFDFTHYWSGSIGTADFTGDGLLDLVVPYQVDFPVGGGFVILAGPDFHHVDDVMVAGQHFGMEVATGDFNSDGNADVILTTSPDAANAGQIAFAAGDGTGHFAAPVFFAAAETGTRPVVADFNGDGALDVALARSTGAPGPGAVVILLGDGHGAFGPPKAYETGTSTPRMSLGLATADFSGDGILDLAVGSGAPNLTIMKGDGKGAFRPCTQLLLPSSIRFPEARNVAAGNFDNKHNADLASVTTDIPIALFFNP